MGSPLPNVDKACVSAVETSCVAWQKKNVEGNTNLQESDARILLTAFQPQGQTVNGDAYCNILKKFREAIQRKRLGLTGPGKSPPGSGSSPNKFMLLIFRYL
jgi:hypothetical protein